MSNSINHTIFFPNKPEVVWEYLTNAALMELWLMKNDFKPIVGHEFKFRTNPLPKFDFDGMVYCKVLEIIPCKKLVYSWKGGTGNGVMTMDSTVVWTLEEKNNGTVLSLEHSGVKGFEKLTIFNAMYQGWLENMQKIYELINKTKYGTTNA